MTLKIIENDLKNGYTQLNFGRLLHIDEIMEQRRINLDLRLKGCYTADGLIYFIDPQDNKPKLAITREKDNPVLNHINQSFDYLAQGVIYRPPNDEVQKAIHASETIIIDLNNLSKDITSGQSHLYLDVGSCGSLPKTNEAWKFIYRLYGGKINCLDFMEMARVKNYPKALIRFLPLFEIERFASPSPFCRVLYVSPFQTIRHDGHGTEFSNYHAQFDLGVYKVDNKAYLIGHSGRDLNGSEGKLMYNLEDRLSTSGIHVNSEDNNCFCNLEID